MGSSRGAVKIWVQVRGQGLDRGQGFGSRSGSRSGVKVVG